MEADRSTLSVLVFVTALCACQRPTGPSTPTLPTPALAAPDLSGDPPEGPLDVTGSWTLDVEYVAAQSMSNAPDLELRVKGTGTVIGAGQRLAISQLELDVRPNTDAIRVEVKSRIQGRFDELLLGPRETPTGYATPGGTVVVFRGGRTQALWLEENDSAPSVGGWTQVSQLRVRLLRAR